MKWLYLYLCLCVYRLLNAALVRTQFDPDEYWQHLEPAYCLVFAEIDFASILYAQQRGRNDTLSSSASSSIPEGYYGRVNDGYGCALTWEWTRDNNYSTSIIMDRNIHSEDEEEGILHNFHQQYFNKAAHGPVRSFVPILPTILLYKFLKHFKLDTNFLVSRGPILLHSIYAAAVVDLCVYIMAGVLFATKSKDSSSKTQSFNSEVAYWALFCSVTSWFMGYAMVRTYSNSFECLLNTLGLTLLILAFRNRSICRKRKLMECVGFSLGGISVASRFGAIFYWIPVGILYSKIVCTNWKQRLYTMIKFSSFGLIGIQSSIAVDYFLYGRGFVFPMIGNLFFNVIQGDSSLYGSHSFYWYMIAGAPAICGTMLLLIVYNYSLPCTVPPCNKDFHQICTTSIITYICGHSLSSHKEFRFIISVLPLVCTLSGSVIRRLNLRPKYIVVLMILSNIPHLIFLIRYHQSGPASVTSLLLDHIMNRQSLSKDYVEIHFLMDCHSTPVYSYLHLQEVKTNVKILDCSPSCRKEERLVCESNYFAKFPRNYFASVYGGNDMILDDTLCRFTNDVATIPDYFVINESQAKIIEDLTLSLNVQSVGCVNHAINGIDFQGFLNFPSLNFHRFCVLKREQGNSI